MKKGGVIDHIALPKLYIPFIFPDLQIADPLLLFKIDNH